MGYAQRGKLCDSSVTLLVLEDLTQEALLVYLQQKLPQQEDKALLWEAPVAPGA